jgi:hypothetical protein
MLRNMKRLNTVDAVITALGGNVAVGRWAGVRSQAISMWKSRGQFPPATYLLFRTELRRRRLSAPDELWRMEAKR